MNKHEQLQVIFSYVQMITYAHQNCTCTVHEVSKEEENPEKKPGLL